MMALNITSIDLPITDPVIKFLIILIIILFAPIILNKIRIPHLLGLIIAGAVIGPHGLNLMQRDSSIILSGTAGLLYIMFLAGLEIDIADFKKNSTKSIVFGLYTFLIPMILGVLSGLYILHFSWATSILLASMFASHTLIAYPLISKFGVTKNKAVTITVGGTIITDTLSLLVLAVIVGMTTGEVNTFFWIKLIVSILIFGAIVLLVFPIIGRWFFKRFNENVSQYIFVLVIVFLGAVLAQLAGIEPIIGAFLSGLALNRLIPHTSPLMNRIDFVGNAIFIPFFLIGVGMLIDYKAFIKDIETLKVALVMIVVATLAKFLAAWFTQKTYGFSNDERRLIFGLSNAQAAATLAAVLVGYNIILGTTDTGEPIRLLNENVLNGTILMIFFTCTVASVAAQKGAKNIALLENTRSKNKDEKSYKERILIPINNIENADELVNLGITIKSKRNKEGLFALSIVDSSAKNHVAEKQAKKILSKVAVIASATDNSIHQLLRFDLNVSNGITSTAREHKITDLIMGLHVKKGISDSFLGNLTEIILSKCNVTTLIYNPAQPFSTIKRHVIIIPENAEKEMGFQQWLGKVWNIGKNSGAKLLFYSNTEVLQLLQEAQHKDPIDAQFREFDDWDNFLILSREFQQDDNLILVMSRKDKPSYHDYMDKIPHSLNKYFNHMSYILIYPMQAGIVDTSEIDFTNPVFRL